MMIKKLRQYLFGDPPKWEEFTRVVDKKGRTNILFIDSTRSKFKKIYID